MTVVFKPYRRLHYGMDYVCIASFKVKLSISLSTFTRHSFILVATNYFTKRVEVISYKHYSKTVKQFIEIHTIHQFVISETITADQGTVFTGREVLDFTKSRGIKMIHSTPYYA